MLLLRPNEVVASGRLVDELWGGDAPKTAPTALQGYVSALRKLLGSDRLATRSGGYVLRVEPAERDLDRFERLVAESASLEPAGASAALRQALELWRGSALADLGEDPALETERRRLAEERLAALEARIDADLARGRHAELVAELESLVGRHPLHERLRARLMLALYRSGRQADALAAYAAARRLLHDELGIEPGAELRDLQRRILGQDPALAPVPREPAPAPSAPPPARDAGAAEQQSRRVVTVIFSDIVDSTTLTDRLDPEALRRVMQRYFATVAAALERHGGTVEKFIGDAVMAVFGVPRVHEDDALRAVRAAVEMRDALAELGDEVERAFGVPLRIRTGVNTGEVIAGDPGAEETLATGEAVVVGRRLEQIAGADEVLLGPQTYELVRDAVVAEAIESLALKGFRESVTAWRVREVLTGAAGVSRHFEAPLVDRTRESALLADALEQAVAERSCRLVTLLGSAGIGKTRLALEFAYRIGDDARVLEGRCLDYGDGMTYWPIKEIVQDAAGISDDDSREEARAKIRRLLPDLEGSDLVAERVSAAIGLADDAAGPEETFWGIRRFLEALTTEQPLVVLVQDLHWAEPTLLDLVEYLPNWSRGAPILLVCLARPELLELRPSFAAGVERAVVTSLGPLTDAESEELMTHLLGEAPLHEAAAKRVAEAAEGNPLFVEEMLRMLVERGLLERVDGDWRPPGSIDEIELPPTIQALLGARLDQLDERERTVLQRAAVMGKVFWWGAVSELSPEPLQVDVGATLQGLVRKRLIEPDPSSFAGEDAFSFGHILIREAAYASLPKELRAELHERYADWIERKAGERAAELDEIVGYHLEQAVRYRQELGSATDDDRTLATRAGELLGAAGRRAFAREDMPAALSLLDRAVALVTEQHPARLELVRELSSALWAVGELARAETLLNGLVAAAEAAGDRRTQWYALLEQAARRQLTESEDPTELLTTAERAVGIFDELGDHVGLARAWRRIAVAHEGSSRYAAAAEAAKRGLDHARHAGDRQEESRLADRLGTSLLYGPAPVEEALALCEALRCDAEGTLLMEANVAIALSGLHAMRGQFDDARRFYASSLGIYEELGLRLPAAGVTQIGGEVELLAGDPVAAERELRRGYAVLEPIGVTAYQAVLLAAALYEQGRHDEAAGYLEASERSRQRREAKVLAGGLRAKLEASRGRAERAEATARQVVLLADSTDALNLRAGARLDLASVLHLVRRAEEAAAAIHEAIDLYRQKGNAASAARAAALLGAGVA